MTLDNLFSRYGSPSDEMNETKHFYYRRADKITNLEDVKHADEKAQRDIAELSEMTELLKEYRQTLYNRAQEFLTAGYTMQLKITRNVDCYRNNKKSYTIEIAKVLDVPNSAPICILREVYEGKERHTALKRFNDLQKLYPNIKTVKEIDKGRWEK